MGGYWRVDTPPIPEGMEGFGEAALRKEGDPWLEGEGGDLDPKFEGEGGDQDDEFEGRKFGHQRGRGPEW